MKELVPEYVYARCVERRSKGEVPTMLGLPGILALMYDKIRRYNHYTEKDEIMDLASDALFAVELAYHQEIEALAKATEEHEAQFAEEIEEELDDIELDEEEDDGLEEELEDR